jgi:hypothetical protein
MAMTRLGSASLNPLPWSSFPRKREPRNSARTLGSGSSLRGACPRAGRRPDPGDRNDENNLHRAGALGAAARIEGEKRPCGRRGHDPYCSLFVLSHRQTVNRMFLSMARREAFLVAAAAISLIWRVVTGKMLPFRLFLPVIYRRKPLAGTMPAFAHPAFAGRVAPAIKSRVPCAPRSRGAPVKGVCGGIEQEGPRPAR